MDDERLASGSFGGVWSPVVWDLNGSVLEVGGKLLAGSEGHSPSSS